MESNYYRKTNLYYGFVFRKHQFLFSNLQNNWLINHKNLFLKNTYCQRDKTEDKKRVFNFGILTSLKSEFCEREISDFTLWKVVTIIKLIYTMVSILESISFFFLIYKVIG